MAARGPLEATERNRRKSIVFTVVHVVDGLRSPRYRNPGTLRKKEGYCTPAISKIVRFRSHGGEGGNSNADWS